MDIVHPRSRASTRRNELIHRLLAGRCEICEDAVNLEVHHVRKLADPNKPGRRDKPAWMHLMARQRKGLAFAVSTEFDSSLTR